MPCSYIHVDQIKHLVLKNHLLILFCPKNHLRAVRERHHGAERSPRSALLGEADFVLMFPPYPDVLVKHLEAELSFDPERLIAKAVGRRG